MNIDFSEIDLTGGLRWNGEAIGSVHYNGERLWPFGVDLLYTGGIGGASYLPDTGVVFADTAATIPATFGGSIGRVNHAGGSGNALQSSTSFRPLLGRAPKVRRNLLVNTDALVTQSRAVTNVSHTLSFKGTGSVARSGASTGTLAGTGSNDRVSVTFAPSAGTLTLTVSGTVTEAQLEVGGLTPYQRVGAATDVTEAGVPSYPFVRFDLSDDRLDTVLPQAVTGDVVIAGRNGSVIAPHSYAANSTFQLGPTRYTGGTHGILRTVGDVVGFSILNKTLTAAERERLMRFYKRRGAKGLLVPGPEMVVNGGFDSAAGWTLQSGYSISGGILNWVSPGFGSEAFRTANGTIVAGRSYLVSLTYTGGGCRISLGGGSLQSFEFGILSQVVVSGSANNRITIFNNNSANFTVDNLSVRELRPEEEW